MSRLPSREINRPPLSPRTTAILSFLQGFVPIILAIGGGLGAVFTYLDNQRNAHETVVAQAAKDNFTRLIEAQRPFLKEQLDRYVETAKTAGELVTLPQSPEWNRSETRFWQLFYTELSMVEDEGVKKAMQDFGRELRSYKEAPTSAAAKGALEQSSYRLAVALRKSIIESWQVPLGSLSSPTTKTY